MRIFCGVKEDKFLRGAAGLFGPARRAKTQSDAVSAKKTHKIGGGRGDRTHDIQLAKLALSQLSYAPIAGKFGLLTGVAD